MSGSPRDGPWGRVGPLGAVRPVQTNHLSGPALYRADKKCDPSRSHGVHSAMIRRTAHPLEPPGRPGRATAHVSPARAEPRPGGGTDRGTARTRAPGAAPARLLRPGEDGHGGLGGHGSGQDGRGGAAEAGRSGVERGRAEAEAEAEGAGSGSGSAEQRARGGEMRGAARGREGTRPFTARTNRSRLAGTRSPLTGAGSPPARRPSPLAGPVHRWPGPFTTCRARSPS